MHFYQLAVAYGHDKGVVKAMARKFSENLDIDIFKKNRKMCGGGLTH